MPIYRRRLYAAHWAYGKKRTKWKVSLSKKIKMFNSDTNSNTTDFDSYGFKKTSNQYIQNMILMWFVKIFQWWFADYTVDVFSNTDIPL